MRFDCSLSVLEGESTDVTSYMRYVLTRSVFMCSGGIEKRFGVREDSLFDWLCRLTWEEECTPAYDEESKAQGDDEASLMLAIEVNSRGDHNE